MNQLSSKLIHPPPRGFKAAGTVTDVAISPCPPPFATGGHRRKGSRARGQTYEKRVQQILCDQYGIYYRPSVWIRFTASGADRWCQPDGMLFRFLDRTITIIEIKLQHTSDAWWQVKHLYYPVLAKAFPEDLWSFNFCEIVKWYDPAVAFPERHHLAADPLAISPGRFGVHILKP